MLFIVRFRKKQFDHETGMLIIGFALLWAEHFGGVEGTQDAEPFVSVHVREVQEPVMHDAFKE